MIGFKSAGIGAFLLSVALIAGCSSGTRTGTDSAPRPAPDQIDSNVGASGNGVQELLVGRFPGVEVARAPAGGITVRIRGASTIMGSAEPLYIIDGARVQSGPGGLLFLDPGDIRKIEVLKDIGSTSYYGSEGANGVILITTKRAR